MATKETNIWLLMIFLLSGLVLGGLLGQLATSIDWLWWLGFGMDFGLETPLILDLTVLKITFGVTFNINVASIIGMTIAIFLYRKV